MKSISKLPIIIAVALLAVTVVVLAVYLLLTNARGDKLQGDETSQCVEEGERYSMLQGSATCCVGLQSITPSSPHSGDCIAVSDGTKVCVNCGDGICGSGENYCICPQDCTE